MRDPVMKIRIAALLLAVGMVIEPLKLDAQTAETPFLTLPRLTNNGLVDAFYSINLSNGTVDLIDQLRRSPTELRVRPITGNLFETIGRSPGQAAISGELLILPIQQADGSARDAFFVETSTGYTAYFDEIGKNNKLGTLLTMLGRPYGPLAATDGNMVLLPKRDGSGRTEGAFLYHGTTGKALFVAGLAKLETDPPITSTVELPKVEGKISAVEILRGDATAAYLIVENVSGKTFFLEPINQDRLGIRLTNLDLLGSFLSDKLNPSHQRFSLLALHESNRDTRAVLVADVATGKIGLIDGLDTGVPRLQVLAPNIYQTLRGGISATPRSFNLIGSGDGAWLLDSLTSTMVYLERPSGDLRLQAVTISR